jgi:hypothetical protein
VNRTYIVASFVPYSRDYSEGLQLIRGKHETFNRFAGDEAIHNLRDVCNPHAPVKKVVGFD